MSTLVRRVGLNLVFLAALATYFICSVADAQAQACKVNAIGSSIGPSGCANEGDNIAYIVDAANLLVPGACDLAPTLLCVFLPDPLAPAFGNSCTDAGTSAATCTAAGGLSMTLPPGLILNPGEFLRFSAADDPGITNCVVASDVNCEYVVPGLNYTATQSDVINSNWRATVCHKGTTVQNGLSNQSENQTLTAALIPVVDIEKSVDPGKICEGTATSVTYSYTVQWGAGANANLNNVVVTDDTCAPVMQTGNGDGDALLELGEVWNYSCTTDISTDTTNTGTVNADDACTGLTVNDSDQATVQANSCDDGNLCTTDSCIADANGAFVMCQFTPIVCNDNNACTTDTCDPAIGCVFTPNPPCNDNNACTTDTCNPAIGCVFTPNPPCNDSNACTTDTCNPAIGCVFTPNAPCNDDNACTTDTCVPATGCVFTPNPPCNDNNACTTDTCVPATGCVFTPNAPCNDDNACTTDTCVPATGCVFTPNPPCNDNNACTTDTCVPATGCVFTPNAPCNDDNACTTDTCVPATGCVFTPNPPCNDNNACTTDTCVPATGCVFTPNAPCNDDNACTTDTCVPATGCVFTPNPPCNDNNACTTDTCVPATGCVFTPNAPCNDDNACTEDSCVPATGCVYTDISATCDDNNACTEDSCVPATGCVYTDISASCDDNIACTADSCVPATGCVNEALDNGDCCSAHGSPGCDSDASLNPNCCEEVCSINPFCCDSEWDSACAQEAINAGCCQVGGEGCTPGYWHLVDDSEGNASHECNWAPPYVADAPHGDGQISGGTLFKDACVQGCAGGTLCFENAFPGKTLRGVLKQGGGGLNALGRHTVAALLNASSPCVEYAIGACEVVEMFNNTFPGSKDDYNALKDIFGTQNEMGCPLGNCNDGPCEE